MMTEWKKYTGAQEQVEEIVNCSKDILGKFKSGNQRLRSSLFANDFFEYLNCGHITEYLICNPHPNADMICQQARTGQEVHIRFKVPGFPIRCEIGDRLITKVTGNGTSFISGMVTNKPNWYLDAEYSFNEFKD